MKPISEILKKLRKENGYTQQQLADALNLEVSSYGKKELGQSDITLSQLESISNFYNMTVIELLAHPSSVSINDKKDINGILSIEIDGKKQNFEFNFK